MRPSGRFRFLVLASLAVAFSSGCGHLLENPQKGKIARQFQGYGCTESEVAIEEVHESPVGPRDHQYRARGCGKDLLFTCESTGGGNSECFEGRGSGPTRSDPESEVKFRMKESNGCDAVQVTKLDETLYRGVGCGKILRYACGNLPGGRGVMCSAVAEEK